jgi:AcrR family transcriptional regulator
MPSKRAKQPEASLGGSVRQRILDAALSVLRDSGLQNLTQVNVAERAGIRQSHLTYYFPTRQDLIEGVSQQFVEAVTRGAEDALKTDSGDGRIETLTRLARSIADLEHMRMFLAVTIEADADDALRKMMVDKTRRMEASIAQVLGGDNALETARVVLAATWGLGLYHFVMRPNAKATLFRAYESWLAEVTAAEPKKRKSTRPR